ncbi:hypothetical protein CFP56_015989 [Quercus suber]|uniref:Uncharacterized protein n=1 Tax=Quercus suber TaxID=58331 RepID=A0AAW0KQN4_QUESU
MSFSAWKNKCGNREATHTGWSRVTATQSISIIRRPNAITTTLYLSFVTQMGTWFQERKMFQP